MTNKIRTTPGVYITELSAFPPSIVGVPTAIPGFIGYTEKAEINGKPMYNKPIYIGSMADFHQYFGGAYKPVYDLKEKDLKPPAEPMFFSEDVSLEGSSGDAPPAPSERDNYDFKVLDASGSLPVWDYYSMVPATVIPPVSPLGTSAFSRTAVVEDSFTEAHFNLYNSMRLFYANGGGECYVVSVGDYSSTEIKAPQLLEGLTAMKEQSGPTMLVMPDLVLLPSKGTNPREAPPQYSEVIRAMLQQCVDLQDRVAVLDVFGSADVRNQLELDQVIGQFRKAVGDTGLNYGMGYFPFVYTSVIDPNEIDYQNIAATSMDALKKVLTLEAENLYPDKDDKGRLDAVKANIALMKARPASGNTPAEAKDVLTINQNLVATIPLLAEIERTILAKNSVLPASGAMAGVFTKVDNTRGVWNAPANVTLNSVIQPTYKLNAKQQGNLNVPVDGKAVDALREFTGRGTVVWGARTLDGNSNDYRYIQVRRTLIYAEQSIKAALAPFVFAANDGNTWTTVVAMVSSFLQGLWSQGGLMGATASEAFNVQCGLGSTMTAQDILEGYMRVQVTLQMIRPAEFIELTFTQKMEGIA